MRPNGLFLCLLVAGPLFGLESGGRWQALLKNNPFVAYEPPKPPPPEPTPTLEFRGRSVEGEAEYFSLYDTKTKKAYWVDRHSRVDGFQVKERNARGELVLADTSGRMLRLALKETKPVLDERSSASAGKTMIAMASPATPGRTSALLTSGPQLTEAHRVEQVAAQIRQRRAQRFAAKG